MKYDKYILDIFKTEKNVDNFIASVTAHIIDFTLKNTQEICATIFEELLVNALIDIGIIPDYNAGSHKSGVDLTIFDQGISAKTFKKKGNILKMSSFRLTKKGNNIESMFELIDEHSKSYNFYFYFIREVTKDTMKYNLCIIPKEQLSHSDFIWDKKHNMTSKKHSGFKTVEAINESLADSLEIVFSQSNQLWLKLNPKKIKKFILTSAEVKLCDVGSQRFVFKLKE